MVMSEALPFSLLTAHDSHLFTEPVVQHVRPDSLVLTLPPLSVSYFSNNP